jgi:uncharacterized protein YyaL (SSP411 family)
MPAVQFAAQPAAARVAWQPWSRATFERAAHEHKFLLLSIQTEWCHWCHVMNDVTYGDAEVTRLLAQHFVAVRADADQRPDLAERYARWGWPATGLMMPNADTIINLRGYQEPHEFSRLLTQIVRGQLSATRPAAPVTQSSALEDWSALRDFLRARLDGLRDPSQGGWGTPQKAPRSAPVEHALFRQLTAADTEHGSFALRALEAYRQLLDPVWGGMFQYSVRGDWTHPHYEKIHSVQANAIENFTLAFHATGKPRYLDDARQVVRYLTEHLQRSDGAFYANQDADVGRPGDAFHREGAAFYALSAEARANSRAPAIDTQVYASYNGMTIAALARLYEASADASFLSSARRAFDAVEHGHRRGAGYTHAENDRDPRLYFEDQLEMARALLALHEVSGEARYSMRLHELTDFMRAKFEAAQGGGFFAQTADPDALGALAELRKPLADNARAARLFLHMARSELDTELRDLAERTLRSAADRQKLTSDAHALAEVLLTTEDMLTPSVTVTIVGESADARTQALLSAALASYAPNRRLQTVAPAQAHYPYPGEPVAYLCSDDACSLPLHEAGAIAPALSSMLSMQP